MDRPAARSSPRYGRSSAPLMDRCPRGARRGVVRSAPLLAFCSVTLSHAATQTSSAGPGDPALLARARSGDRDALSALYRLHASEMLALAARLTGSRSDAEDVVQDLFLRLPRALARYDERGRFLPWLKQLTVRTALVR